MKLTRNLGNRYAGYRIRKQELFPVDIATALCKGGKTLVCIPEDPTTVMDALNVCDRISEWFGPVEVVILGTGTEQFRLPANKHSVLAIPVAINTWGLPHKQIIRRVAGMRPTISVDLHPTFSLATAYLCVMSGARLRVGFHGPDQGYFNLQFNWKTGKDTPLGNHYQKFLTVVDSLRTSVGAGDSLQ